MHNKINLSDNRTEIADELNTKSLERLFSGQTCVLKMPNFCSENICNLLSEWLLSSGELKPCYNEIRKNNEVNYLDFGVDSNTICFNTTYFTDQESDKFKEYYAASLKNIRIPRQIIKPNITPIDKLRLELDEVWPKGSMVANFNGIKNTVGLFRVVPAERSELLAQSPHIDSLPRNYKDLAAQYTANIYFKVPDIGGELEIWDIEPLSNLEIDKSNFDAEWRNSLPNPLKIKPMGGELIIFNARKPHAVNSFSEGKRLSVQCFLGITHEGTILMWS
jgi:hypothetical protein